MRLLTYNIHKGIGGRDRRYRLDRVVAVIEAEEPDIIFLQEVDRGVPRSGHDDQPAILSKHFGCWASLYQQNVRLKFGGYGNLVLSRWPFHSHHQISLRLRSKKPRGAQIVVLNTPEGEFQAANFHLGLAEQERHWQIRHLLGHPLYQEGAHLPQLIAGDYNDWRNTLALHLLARHGFQQATRPPWAFRSFPAYMAMGSLDKAFYRGGVVIQEVRIVRTPLSRSASDHLPLVIDFTLDGNGQATL